jgi:hypothetical protein
MKLFNSRKTSKKVFENNCLKCNVIAINITYKELFSIKSKRR